MENQKPGSKAQDWDGIALMFVVMLMASVTLASVACPFICTDSTCSCPGWGMWSMVAVTSSSLSAGCKEKFYIAEITGDRVTLWVGQILASERV